MVHNPLVYPDDFVSGSRFLGTNKSTLTIESALSTVELQARDTALRQAHTRRIAGQGEIANQNKLMRISSSLMPLQQVGKAAPSSPFLGTEAYLGGGRQGAVATDYLTQFLFSNEIFIPCQIKLSLWRLYMGTAGNAESGKFCGGYATSTGTFAETVDKLIYANGSGKLEKIQEVLSQPLMSPVGGMGDRLKGILVGGVLNTGRLSRDTHVYDHVTDRIRLIANHLTTPRFAAHNGLSSKTSGYIWQGTEKHFNGVAVRVVDRINYSAADLAAVPISVSVASPQAVHAAFSNPRKGYIAGGFVDVRGALSDAITGFTFSGEVAAPLTTRLDQPRVCADGTGSSVAGYTVGGSTATASSTKTTQKLDYLTETNRVIDAQLGLDLSDQGAIANYSPGFSY